MNKAEASAYSPETGHAAAKVSGRMSVRWHGARQREHAMSIDTYDTLAMIRPSASARYNLDWIEQLAREVAEGGGATVTRKPAFQGDIASVCRRMASS